MATTLPKRHLFLGDWFSFSNTTSSTFKFLRQYRSSLFKNSPGGRSTSFVFPVSNILGGNGDSERGSLSVSTVRGLLLIGDSASERNVLSDSSSRRFPCSQTRPLMTFLIDLICLSHTPPKLLLALRSSALACVTDTPLFWCSSTGLLPFRHDLFSELSLVP